MYDVCIVSDPGQTWEQQWSYVLSHFEIRDVYHIGPLDPRVRPFRDAIEIASAEELPGTLVVLAPTNGRYFQGEESLHDFEHPEECVYLFGSDHRPLSEDQMGSRVPDHLVYIPTATADTCYSFVAGAMALYDRELKSHG